MFHDELKTGVGRNGVLLLALAIAMTLGMVGCGEQAAPPIKQEPTTLTPEQEFEATIKRPRREKSKLSMTWDEHTSAVSLFGGTTCWLSTGSPKPRRKGIPTQLFYLAACIVPAGERHRIM